MFWKLSISPRVGWYYPVPQARMAVWVEAHMPWGQKEGFWVCDIPNSCFGAAPCSGELRGRLPFSWSRCASMGLIPKHFSTQEALFLCRLVFWAEGSRQWMLVFVALGGKAHLGDSFYWKIFPEPLEQIIHMAESARQRTSFPQTRVRGVTLNPQLRSERHRPSRFSLHSSSFLFWAPILSGSYMWISVNSRTLFSPDVSLQQFGGAYIFPGC